MSGLWTNLEWVLGPLGSQGHAKPKIFKKNLAFPLLYGGNADWTGFLTKYSECDVRS